MLVGAVRGMSVDLNGPHFPVAIVAEHASAQFGGEAALPLHYFRVLLARGWPVWLICHARVRHELDARFPQARDRVLYIEDNRLHRWMWRLGQYLPARLSYITTGYVSRLSTQWAQRRVLRRLISSQGIRVVHQPMPVSPKEPSVMYGLGVPVIIGPLNGGMDYPPAFQHGHTNWTARVAAVGRLFSGALNHWSPGKLQAAMVLVANERTRAALPKGLAGQVLLLPENGVDMTLWQDKPANEPPANAVTQFVFMGRLVDWKAVDLLLQAFAQARSQAPMSLTILGDGPEAAALKALAATLSVQQAEEAAEGCVTFAGWQAQTECARQLRDCDALVLPSLWECGGAVVLEAMACAKPVIATAWGGPTDYLNEHCGILVPPTDRQSLINGIANAMVRLAKNPDLRAAMGQHGRERVMAEFDWDRKVDHMINLYRRVLA